MTPFIVAAMILAGFVIAHVVGLSLSRRMSVRPGHAREVMPTLPVAPVSKGLGAEQRWNASIRRVEEKLIKEFENGVEGAEASVLAGQIGEDETLVDAALERLREEIPCRLRITQSGRMLHDFDGEDIRALARMRTASWPLRASVFVLAALANVGAIWPVILMLTLALVTLNAVMGTATSAEGEIVGVAGLLYIAAAGFGAVALSLVARLLLTPLISVPKIGPSGTQDTVPERWHQTPAPGNAWYYFDIPFWSSRGSLGSGSSSSSSSGGGFDVDLDDAGQAIVIVLLVIVIAVCTIAIAIWARGLWFALMRRDDELERVSPGFWVRTAERLDAFERYMPTNDLVGRMARSLRRAYAHRRPMDADLGARVLALASHCNYQPSTIDISLNEGLDAHEAAEVGSRLCGIVGGQIGVTDEGDLIFALPPHVVDEVRAGLDDDLWAEYLDYEGMSLTRRKSQQPDSLPLNMVGITKGHLDASSRLVGGTLLMVVSTLIFLNPSNGLVEGYFGAVPTWLTASLAIIVGLFAMGTIALTTAVRYTAEASTIVGVRRDSRRAAFYAIRRAIERGEPTLDLEQIANKVEYAFRPAWNAIERDDVIKEIEGVLIDLDLSPSLEAGGSLVVDLAPLRRRIDAARRANVEDVLSGVSLPDAEVVFGDDAVVFDTQIEHDRISVLA